MDFSRFRFGLCARLVQSPLRGNRFVFCCQGECEKSSEIITRFEKTSHPSLVQAAPCLTTEAQSRRGFAGQMRATIMAKRTKITIETDSLLVLRRRRTLRAWCPQCAAESEMIPIEGVKVISKVESWVESESIHRSQAPDGAPLICLNSLLKRASKTKTA